MNRIIITLINHLVLIFSIVLINSCETSKSTDEFVEIEVVEADKIDCDCSEIEWEGGKVKRLGYLFTGVCQSKNAQNEIIERKEYNNGYPIRIQEWKEVNKKMVQIKDMKYYDGNRDEGFIMELITNKQLSITYSSSYEELKGGERHIYWQIAYSSDIHSSWLSYSNNIDHNCVLEDNFQDTEERSAAITFLECIENQNIPNFFYSVK